MARLGTPGAFLRGMNTMIQRRKALEAFRRSGQAASEGELGEHDDLLLKAVLSEAGTRETVDAVRRGRLGFLDERLWSRLAAPKYFSPAYQVVRVHPGMGDGLYEQVLALRLECQLPDTIDGARARLEDVESDEDYEAVIVGVVAPDGRLEAAAVASIGEASLGISRVCIRDGADAQAVATELLKAAALVARIVDRNHVWGTWPASQPELRALAERFCYRFLKTVFVETLGSRAGSWLGLLDLAEVGWQIEDRAPLDHKAGAAYGSVLKLELD